MTTLKKTILAPLKIFVRRNKLLHKHTVDMLPHRRTARCLHINVFPQKKSQNLIFLLLCSVLFGFNGLLAQTEEGQNPPRLSQEYYWFLAEQKGGMNIEGISEVHKERYKGTDVYSILTYDEKVVEVHFYKKGVLSNNEMGWAIQKVVREQDKERRCHYDSAEVLLDCYEFVLNEKGQKIEKHYLDKDLKPINNKEGIAVAKYELEEEGFVKSETWFDAEGKQVPVQADWEIYQMTYEYDTSGYVQKESYLDKEGNLSRVPNGGYAIIESTFENDRKVRLAYFDVEGKKMLHQLYDFHQIMKKYNAQLQLTEYKHLDVYNNLRNSRNGNADDRTSYASKTLRYDAQGNLIGILFFDAQNRFIGRK